MSGNPTHYAGDLPRVLLDEAKEMIASDGIEGLTLRSLAKRVGDSHAAPGHHFGSRAGLLSRLAVEGSNCCVHACSTSNTKRRPRRETPVAHLEAAGRAYTRFSADEPALFAVMFQFAQHDRSDPGLAAAGLGALQVLIDSVDELGRTQGLDDRARQTLVIEAWSLVYGLASLWHSHPLPARLPGHDAGRPRRPGARRLRGDGRAPAGPAATMTTPSLPWHRRSPASHL